MCLGVYPYLTVFVFVLCVCVYGFMHLCSFILLSLFFGFRDFFPMFLSNFRKFISVQGNWYIAMILVSSFTRRVKFTLYKLVYLLARFGFFFLRFFFFVFNSRSNHNLSFPLVFFVGL